MKVRNVLLNVTAAVISFATVSQAAILVGPTGSGTNTFDAAPTATEWSTLGPTTSGAPAYEGAAGTCALDANIRTRDASTITSTLTTATAVPPGTSAIAQWNSTGLHLQTRPTASDYIILMATLQNDSGGPLTALSVSYDFSINGADTTESIKKHRSFFSLTGAPGSWALIPEFTGADPGTLTATLNLGSWASGNLLYIIWADDNGSNPDGGYIIDNFSAIGTTPSAAPVVTITSISIPDIPPGQPTYCWTNFAGPGGVFAGAYGATVGPDGNIYTASLGSGKLHMITPAGVVTELLASVPSPIELAVSATTTNLYVACNGFGVYKVVPPYGAGDTTQLDGGDYTTFGVAVDSATETVYSADRGNHVIYVIPNAGTATILAGQSGMSGNANDMLLTSLFNAPTGIALVKDGTNTHLYVVEQGNNRIRHIDITGDTVTTLAGGGGGCGTDGIGTAANFNQPSGCTLGPDGNLYIADQDNLLVRKVTLPGAEVTTLGGVCGFGTYGFQDGCGSDARFATVGQVGTASDGTLYVADRGSAPGGSGGNIWKGTLQPGTPGGPGTDLQIDFTVPANYPACAASTLQSSSTVDGTYADVAATITSLGGNSWRAVIAPSGDVQFYRIRFSY